MAMQNIPATKVGRRFQVAIPKRVREAVGLRAGDIVQARVGKKGTIVLSRKILADSDVDLQQDLEAAAADAKAGRVLGPFTKAGEAIRALDASSGRRANARRAY